MKKLMGEQLNPRDIDEIIRDVDLNGDGQVDFEGEGKRSFLTRYYSMSSSDISQTYLQILSQTNYQNDAGLVLPVRPSIMTQNAT